MTRYAFVFLSLIGLLATAAGCAGNDAADNPTGTIEGTVTVEGGDAAVDALVELQSRSEQTRTDEEGLFTLEDIPTGTYTLRLTLQGYVTNRTEVEVSDGQTSEPMITLQEVNEPPTIDQVSLDSSTLEPAGTTMLSVTASDPNPADTLTYSYSASDNFSVSGDGNSATVTAPDAFGAQGSVTVQIEDEEGRTASERVSMSTVTNTAPSINSVTASPSTLTPGGTAEVVINASDAEGDALTYQWNAPSGWSIDDPSASEIQVTAPDSYGASALLEVTVTDTRDFSATASIGLSTVMNNGPVISSVTASPPTVQRGGTITLDASASDPNGDSLSYTWSAPANWSLSSTTAESPTLTAPNTPSATAQIDVTVEDSEGLSASGSVVVATEPNNAPTVSNVVADNANLSRGGSTDVSVSASDPDEDALSYSWTLGNSAWSKSGSGQSITLTAPNTPSSSTLVTVTVTDSVGATTQSSTVVQTVPNQPPTISSVYPTNNPVARSGSTDVNVDATDPNGDSLTYSWSLNSGNWSISGSGDTVTLNAPSTASTSVLVTVTVEDNLGATTTGTTQVSTAANQAPTITTVPNIPNSINAGRSAQWTYDADATDPDDTNLTWSVSTTPPSVDATVDSNGVLEVTPDREHANSTISVALSVTDGNNSTTQTVNLQVDSLNFQAVGNFSVASTIDNVVAFADFDDDGLDEIAGRDSDATLSYNLSSANNGFDTEYTQTWSSPPFSQCRQDRAADMDADGDMDVITLCNEDSAANDDLSVAVWTNNLSGMSSNFTPGPSLNTGVASNINDFATTDINNDDAAELILADSADDLHVISNDGSGTLSVGQTISLSVPSGATGYSIDRVFVAQLDGDAEMEVVAIESYNAGSGGTTRASVLSFNSMGTLASSRDSSVNLQGNPDKVEVADLTDDGHAEIITKAQETAGGDWGVESYVNDGSANFMKVGSVQSADLCNDTGNRGIAVGDIDGDSITDVVVGNDCDGSVHVAFGDGTGAFSDFLQLNQSTLGSDETENVFVGDYNNDGIVDIYAYDWGRLSVYF